MKDETASSPFHPKHILVLFFALVLAAAGCAGYVKDRFKDASEVFEFGVGVSKGMSFNVRATKAAQAGVGSYSGIWCGLKEGFFCSWLEERSEFGLTPLHFHEVYRKSDRLVDIRHPLPWDPGYATYLDDLGLISDRGFFEVGVTADVLFFGVDVDCELAELADFVSGFFGWDMLGDDAFSVPPAELVRRLESRSAWKRYAAARALRRLTGKNRGYALYTIPEEHTENQVESARRWKAWLKNRSGEDAAGSAP